MHSGDDYYAWLLKRIEVVDGCEYEDYTKLVYYLYSREYYYILEKDANREKGGLSLRSLYASERGFYLEDVKDGPCTVLEMLIALSQNIYMCTDTPLAKWFWEMIGNLDLLNQTNTNYDENYISSKIDTWLNRKFSLNGEGSLFPLGEDYDGDSRSMEIWDQMNTYLVKFYPVGKWIT